MNYEQILSFWFEEIEPRQWWNVDPAFDALLRERYAQLLCQAARGELYEWRESAPGRLAEILVLDQFSRNIHRDTPQAYAQDGMALVLAQEAVAAGALDVLEQEQRGFLLMPYMHSESPAIHVQAERLFKAFTSATSFRFEVRHKEIIDRFGRYPHRNQTLGRESSEQERAFLKEPGSSF
ncbi:DUF924 family protein [Pseudomonas mangrovi]|uniref:DUF924 domain-containing protein n=1 Tax=Pseudomonas mangrovi TaxID=2161748 RepID=A0A2T5PCH4_9PSED|nr:DUF924 family protein [Pseudomonas mangrovi]PTU75448.1 DUF924 domain-containing protein [Pseudomonas mangrovi]